MYGSSYMFRHYIALLRESSECLLGDAQLRRRRGSTGGGGGVFNCPTHHVTKEIKEMHGSRSKMPSKKSRQAALRGGI
jgi:hypothetical protein